MTRRKERLSVTVDGDLISEGKKAVLEGRSDSLSVRANAALSDRAARDEKLEKLAAAIADYESEFGTITDDEMAAVTRTNRETPEVPGFTSD